MIASLPLFHRIAGKPVIVLGEGEAADAKRRLVERAGGRIALADDGEARLAFVALDQPEEAAGRLRARGVLVNVVDRPDLCDFTTPAIVDRDPVLIAVGTGGASAGLAKALRLRLDALLPAALGKLADALFDARSDMRAKLPDAGERRHALDAALEEGGTLDPLREGAADKVQGWLADAAADPANIVEIRLLSEDPDDLTLRQARWLGAADVVAHAPDVPPEILDRARADAIRIVLEAYGPPPTMPGLTVILRRDLAAAAAS